MLNRGLILAVEGILTALVVMLVIGHRPLAGEVVLSVSSDRGLNSGDIPVVAAWLVATGLLISLWVRQSPRSRDRRLGEQRGDERLDKRAYMSVSGIKPQNGHI